MNQKKRLRILWLSHFVPYPPKGGNLLRSYNLIREAAVHHDIDVLTFVQKKPLQTMFPTAEQGIAEARQHMLGFCKRIEFFDIHSENSRYGNHLLALKSLFTADAYNINWLKSAEFAARAKQLATENLYDVVHFDTISLATHAELFANTPKVLNHHNIESHMLLRRAENETNLLKKLYFFLEGKKLENYEQRKCKLFNSNITCSKLDKERLEQIVGTANVESIPNGVDLEYFTPDEKITPTPDSLIFAGGLGWYPNAAAMHFFADTVWPLLKRRRPNIILNVIGRDPTPHLKSIAAKDACFRIHGFVDDVRTHLNAAAVYVCPIKDGGGTKLKILDALAMQKAIVADEIACEGIDVINGKNVIFAQSPEQYVEAILKILDSPELRNQLGKAGRQLVSDNYSYREIGARLAGIYASIASGG